MKILFILPFKISDEPLGVMYLSSVLKEAGHRTELAIIETDDLKKVVQNYSPDILAFSITTGTQQKALDANRLIKELLPDVFSIFGGPHPTFFPDFIKNNGIDACCIGEGEGAILDLVTKLENNENINHIPNLQIKKDGQIFYNKVRPLINNLDSLPFPDRDLLLKHKHYRKSETSYFITSRGCPYNCTYCFNHVYKEIYKGDKIVRQRSVNNVIAEIKSVKDRHNIKFVRFVDDNIILSSKWQDEFTRKYKQEIDIPFMCYTRPETINKHSSQKLAEAGCISIVIGIEAGNDNIRHNLLNRNIDKQQMINAAQALKKNNIGLMLENMLGLPCTTIAEDIETLDLNIACKPDYAWVSIYQPYPNTKLGEIAKSVGLFDGDINRIPSTYYSQTILNLPNKTQIDYLHKLFAITVRFPWLKPIVLKAINVTPNKPPNKTLLRIYNLLFILFKTYAYSTKLVPKFPKLRNIWP